MTWEDRQRDEAWERKLEAGDIARESMKPERFSERKLREIATREWDLAHPVPFSTEDVAARHKWIEARFQELLEHLRDDDEVVYDEPREEDDQLETEEE